MILNWQSMSSDQKLEALRSAFENLERRVDSLSDGVSTAFKKQDKVIADLTDRLKKLEG